MKAYVKLTLVLGEMFGVHNRPCYPKKSVNFMYPSSKPLGDVAVMERRLKKTLQCEDSWRNRVI